MSFDSSIDADVGTERMLTPHPGEHRQFTPQIVLEQREFHKEEANRERREASDRRAVKEALKSAVAETVISQSSAHEHMLLEEEFPIMFEKLDMEVSEDSICSTGNVTHLEAHPAAEEEVISSKICMSTKLKDTHMSEVDSGMHGEELSDWMSQLFEKLDMEVSKDSICSTGNVTQVEAHPAAEKVISSKICMSTKLKDTHKSEVDSGMHGEELSDWMSQLFEKLDMEVSEDSICSTGNVTQVAAHPATEKVISSKIRMSTKLKDTHKTRTNVKLEWIPMEDRFYFYDSDEFQDELLRWLNMGGRNDILSQSDLDQAAAHTDMRDEISDLDKDAEDSDTSKKEISNKETLENGIKWMSEECFLAFIESAEINHLEGIEHKFGELHKQCLNIVAYDKIFHHYNFTIEAKYGSSGIWSSKLYFAEVKQLLGVKSYFCCLLEPTDDGRCYGCQNMKCDLQHPSSGGYEEGDADMCWPFIDETDSGSDDECICSLGF